METKPLKIAFLNTYQGKVSRGAETFVEELSQRLSTKHQVDVISEINYLKLLLGKYNVIVPTNGRMQVFITRLICWLCGTKMIVSGQSGLGADDKWNLLCFPDTFVALTKHQKNWAHKFSPWIKVIDIPNGVDLEEFKPDSKSLETDLPHPIILCVAALVSEKRLDLVIKAVAKLKASLLIVGSGDKEKELQRLGDRLLPGRFEILQFPHSQMHQVYPACDLFTYPTVAHESFGIVMLEAMASGLPVVANDDPIRKEIIAGAGFFVNPVDTDKYADTLEKALDIKWGDKPRNQAEKFSWDKIATEYEVLIQNLAK